MTHKEKIKQMKENVDVLTLTATPIPRTLHMSLIGIRDMSVLEEPPMDRVPIQTYVMEYNEEMVREAIIQGAVPRRTGILCIQPCAGDCRCGSKDRRSWCRRRTLPLRTGR